MTREEEKLIDIISNVITAIVVIIPLLFCIYMMFSGPKPAPHEKIYIDMPEEYSCIRRDTVLAIRHNDTISIQFINKHPTQ